MNKSRTPTIETESSSPWDSLTGSTTLIAEPGTKERTEQLMAPLKRENQRSSPRLPQMRGNATIQNDIFDALEWDANQTIPNRVQSDLNQFKDTILAEFHKTHEQIQLTLVHRPETRWIQNLRHPSYHLREPIPIVVERNQGTTLATYDDIGVSTEGKDIQDAITKLCAAIVAAYEKLKQSKPPLEDSATHQYAFLEQIIQEKPVQSFSWEELTGFYREHLKKFQFVKAGYIHTDGKYAELIIRLADFSVDWIEELAQIELDVVERWPDIRFDVEYITETISSIDNLARFYKGE
jgi:hypothetical protein